MPDLPVRIDLRELRRQAEDLSRPTLAAAQIAVAREYGFPSWSKLQTEVERRQILDERDLTRLDALLAEDPSLAAEPLTHWCDHHDAPPLTYIAMLRFDSERLGLPRDLPGTGDVARTLIAAGAPVDGRPGERETPLITAASYGDVDVARALVEAGADVDARAADDAGGVPGGSALLHAAVFGMTDVLDLLVAAGARVTSLEEAAAAGDVEGWLAPDAPLQARIRALVFAADHQRLPAIDRLIEAGTPVDAVDETFGRQALQIAAQNGRPESVRRLLAHGADPDVRDEHGHTPLELCRPGLNYFDGPSHREVEAILLEHGAGG